MQSRIPVLAVLVLVFIPLRADEAKDLRKDLQERFLKKILVIRNFYGGDHLFFDVQGKLLAGAEEDCWCAAQIKIKKLGAQNGTPFFPGTPLFGSYLPN